ncbi:hypothetical protein HK101_005690 [Irineochytrium annulatum]|nr:hypothetical protein HK101_005690 [Irineochytrium annulatum]
MGDGADGNMTAEAGIVTDAVRMGGEDSSLGVGGVGMPRVSTTQNAKESLASKFKDHNRYSKTMKRMLELLCNEAGFLVEEKLQKLLAPLQRDEQSLMKLDSIFKALGVETVEDIEKLTSYFVARDKEPHMQQHQQHQQAQQQAVAVDQPPADTPPADDASPDTAVSPSGVTGDVELAPPPAPNPAPRPSLVPHDIVAPHAPNQQMPGLLSHSEEPHTLLIHPNEVVKAIRRFVEDHRNERASRRHGGAGGGHERAAVARDEDWENKEPEAEEHEEEGAGGGKSRSDMQREYWERMQNIIDDKSYRIWTVDNIAKSLNGNFT